MIARQGQVLFIKSRVRPPVSFSTLQSIQSNWDQFDQMPILLVAINQMESDKTLVFSGLICHRGRRGMDVFPCPFYAAGLNMCNGPGFPGGMGESRNGSGGLPHPVKLIGQL